MLSAAAGMSAARAVAHNERLLTKKCHQSLGGCKCRHAACACRVTCTSTAAARSPGAGPTSGTPRRARPACWGFGSTASSERVATQHRSQAFTGCAAYAGSARDRAGRAARKEGSPRATQCASGSDLTRACRMTGKCSGLHSKLEGRRLAGPGPDLTLNLSPDELTCRRGRRAWSGPRSTRPRWSPPPWAPPPGCAPGSTPAPRRLRARADATQRRSVQGRCVACATVRCIEAPRHARGRALSGAMQDIAGMSRHRRTGKARPAIRRGCHISQAMRYTPRGIITRCGLGAHLVGRSTRPGRAAESSCGRRGGSSRASGCGWCCRW